MNLLTTNRLIIREFKSDDLQTLYSLSQEQSMRDFLPDQVYETIDKAEETLDFLMSKYSNDLSKIGYPYVLALALKDTDELIGHVGLSKIQEGVEIGYAIAESYQRKGFATEAVTAFTDWAKTILSLDAIYAVVKSKNIGSCRILEKTGFEFIKEEDRESFGVMYKQKLYKK